MNVDLLLKEMPQVLLNVFPLQQVIVHAYHQVTSESSFFGRGVKEQMEGAKERRGGKRLKRE